MFELLQELIAYKYACKIKHWQSLNYGEHLLYDRLIENVDNFVDDIAEKAYMSAGNASAINSDILCGDLINLDLYEMINSILERIDAFVDENDAPEGILTLLGDVSKDFLTKLALVRMENAQ